ncbi:hypothetical protein MKX08_007154 [Trichoderma sp. CBMAI-0020]|nr:hypothetical protein MKX08_007154 [Trichoderma sp. CBMAI-0020]WOD46602.1 hypothetical protein [Trichoderma atroviride]
MRYLNPIFAFFALLALRVYGLDAPIPGYGVVELEWEVETTPGGPTVLVNGTIEAVYDKLTKINPNFTAEYPLQAKNHAANGTLEKRYTVDGYLCWSPWPYTSFFAIDDGVSYLRGVRGQPTNGPGPGNCGRVSCSYQSAIWWCNDNSQSKTLQDFGAIADGAEFIAYNCNAAVTVAGIPEVVTAGQIFYTDAWNVIVRKDRDNC